jgi:hypothetical protein
MKVSSNQAIIPTPPVDLDLYYQRHMNHACNVFNFPVSLLSKEGISKNNSQSDLQKINKVVNTYVGELQNLFDDMLGALELDGECEFHIAPQTFVDLEPLLKLVDSESYHNKHALFGEIESTFQAKRFKKS